MYVCIYIYVCMYIYICMYVWLWMYIYIYTYVCMYVCMYVYIYIYKWVQVKIQGPEQGPGPHPFHTPVPYLRSIPVWRIRSIPLFHTFDPYLIIYLCTFKHVQSDFTCVCKYMNTLYIHEDYVGYAQALWLNWQACATLAAATYFVDALGCCWLAV